MRCVHCAAEVETAAFCPACGREVAATGEVPGSRAFQFHGTAETLFPIFIRNLLLSIVTLGIYSFWARSEFRRYFLSHLELAGERFEYHGTGRELFRGFLRALPVLVVLGALYPLGIYLEGKHQVAAAAACFIGMWLGLLALMPAALALSWRYRLSRTSYRGVRFSWRGSLGEVYRAAFLGGLATIVTLGICYPLLQARLRQALVGRSYFGNVPFEYHEDGRGLVGPHFLSGLLFYPTLGFYSFWYRAREQRYIFSGTRFGGGYFWSSITGGDLCRLDLGNALLLIFTLGLAWPVAAVRSWRTTIGAVCLVSAVDLGGIVQEARSASADGDALDSVFDADLAGLDLGL